MRILALSVWLYVILLMGHVSLEAATFYKYTDENGTIVLTDHLGDIPKTFRESATKIILEDEAPAQTKKPLVSEKITALIRNKKIGEEQIRQGKAYLSSLLKGAEIDRHRICHRRHRLMHLSLLRYLKSASAVFLRKS